MRCVQDSLPRHFHAGLSYNETGCTLKISKSVVGKHVSMARAAGATEPLGVCAERAYPLC